MLLKFSPGKKIIVSFNTAIVFFCNSMFHNHKAATYITLISASTTYHYCFWNINSLKEFKGISINAKFSVEANKEAFQKENNLFLPRNGNNCI